MQVKRVNETALTVETETVNATIYANEQVHLERSALEELNEFGKIQGIKHLSFTPDFHRGAGTPIGTVALIDRVYPRVVGNDIGCGMRFDVTELDALDFTPELANRLRHAFFGGGREIYLDNRSDLLAYGLESTLQGYSSKHIPTINKAHQGGSLGSGDVSAVLKQFVDIDTRRDNFLGSIGGGNHFVEIQQVDEIVDKATAWRWGLNTGKICIMCHSGSLDLGHVVGNYFNDKARELWQGKYPENGYFFLPDELGLDYIRASYNVANFATVNRAVMSSMVAGILDSDLKSVYDSPHNLVWLEGNHFIHRKGSCPAAEGEPVIIPGSMGTRSLLAIGQGFHGTMSSSPHGAGRVLNRNAARNISMEDIHVITKVDIDNVRSDVAIELRKTLAEEAPTAYKDIKTVADSVAGAGIAKPVAWMRPIMTLKG